MRTFVLCLTIMSAHATVAAEPSRQIIDEFAQSMQDRDYARAVELIDKAISEKPASADYLSFLKGRALQLNGDLESSVTQFDQIAREFPESRWARHARFAKAMALARLKRYDEAEQIYRREAETLLSVDRKHEIAGIYREFADAAFRPEDKQQEPDYQRALDFYRQALAAAPSSPTAPTVQLRIAQCLNHRGEHGPAIAELDQLLAKQPPDAVRIEARYLKGVCQLAQGQPADARRTWTDLITDDRAKTGDLAESVQDWMVQAQFQIPSTYALPEPANNNDLALGIAALDTFIQDHPHDKRVPQAMLLAAQSYVNRNRLDRASERLRQLISQDEYRDTDQIAEARFLLGDCYLRQKEFQRALDAWQEFLQVHPSHAKWSEAQRRVIDTEYLRAVDAAERKQYADARQQFQAFLAKYPLEPRTADIAYQLGNLQYEQENWQAAIDDWRQVVSKYPNTDVASLAQLMIGITLEEKLERREESLEAYRQVTWGAHQSTAAQRIQQLQATQLVVRSPRVFRSNEAATLTLVSRNLEQVDVRIYAIDLETYFRKMHLTTGIESLDVSLIDPDHVFTYEIPEYEKYAQTEHAIEIPRFEAQAEAVSSEGPRVLVVTVGSETMEATTLVLQSDLDIVLKASRHEAFVYAQNMRTGKAWANARVLVSDGDRVLLEGMTGDDGVFRHDLDEGASIADLRVFAVDQGHAASSVVGLNGLSVAQGLTTRGLVYTDRAVYRPGQLVHVKAVIRRVADDVFQIQANEAYELTVFDSRNRTVWHEDVTTDEWGSVGSRFLLPQECAAGNYRVLLSHVDGQQFQGDFQVQPFHIENIDLRVEAERQIYFRGETIVGKIIAAYAFGGPVVGKNVRYQLAGGRSFSGKTNDQGELAFELETTDFQESQTLGMHVEMPDMNLAIAHPFVLSATGFGISIKTSRDYFLSQENFSVELVTSDPLGKPVERDLTLRVLRRETTEGHSALVPVSEHEVRTSATGKGAVTLQLPKGGTYVLRAEGEDQFRNAISSEHHVLISDEDDDVRLRILANQLDYKVGDQAEIKLHWREEPATALVTYQGARILGYQLVELVTGENRVLVPMGQDLAPNFELSITVMTDSRPDDSGKLPRRLHQASSEFTVERDLRVDLEVAGPAGNDSHRPGEEVEVRIRTTDPQGRPQSADLSLAVVEKSLVDLFGTGSQSISDYFGVGRRASQVRTLSSIEFSYNPPTVQISESLLEELERLSVLENESAAESSPESTRWHVEDSELADQDSADDWFDAPGSDEFSPVDGNVAIQQADRGFGGGLGGMGVTNNWAALAARPQSATASPRQPVGNRFLATDPSFQFDSRNLDLARGVSPNAFSRGELKSLLIQQRQAIVTVDKQGIANYVKVPVGSDQDWAGFESNLRSSDALLLAESSSRETAYWNPLVRTDDQGLATVRFPLPPRSTAWHLLAKGATKQTLVGEGERDLIARDELFATMKLPSSLTDGDRIEIPIDIHRESDAPASCTVELHLKCGAQSSVQTKQVQLTNRLQSVAFEVLIQRPENTPSNRHVDCEISLSVESDTRTSHETRVLPVHPQGLPLFSSSGGLADSDTATWVELPEGIVTKPTGMTIVVGPNLHSSLLDIVLGGSGRPDERLAIGATDSVSSDLLAATAVQRQLRRSDTESDPAARAVDRRIRELVGLAVSSQRDDGGWSWAGRSSESDWLTTARMLWALSTAIEAGYDVPIETRDRAIQFAQQAIANLGGREDEARAVLLHALATVNQGDFALANRLYRIRPSLSTSAKLYLSLALNQMQRQPMARDILQTISESTFDQEKSRRLAPQGCLPANQAAVELRALYLIALLDTEPGSTKIDEIARRLLADRRGNRWIPDKATGPATIGLAKWNDRQDFTASKYELLIKVNDHELQKLTLDETSPVQTVDINPDWLHDQGKQHVTFHLTGRGHYSYQCLLEGFAPTEQLKSTTDDWRVTRDYQPAPREYDGRPVDRGYDVVNGSYQPVHNLLTQLPVGQRGEVHLYVARNGVPYDAPIEELEYLVVTERLPSGVSVIPNSVQGSFDHYELSPGKIVFYVGKHHRAASIRFDVHGYLPGDYRVPPTTVQDAYRPSGISVADARQLTVLDEGESSKDEYRLTPKELFEFGRFAHERRDMKTVLDTLETLRSDWRLKPDVERQVTSMLLDASLVEGPSRKVVQYFEIVKERFSDMEIPHDKILKIGAAYHEMGEFERCYLIFRATVESSFLADSRVAGFLQERGEILRGIRYMEDLLAEYPPEAYAAAATFDLAQQVYALAPQAPQDPKLREQKVTRVDLIQRSARMLDEFLTVHPDDPAADQAAFARINTLLDLQMFRPAIDAGHRYVERYPESDDLDNFWYTIGYCHFALGDHAEALDVCQKVRDMERTDRLSGRALPSSNRDRAIYILGQIHHSLGRAAEAIAEYQQVESLFADAREAIKYFQRQEVSLPEVSRFLPGEPFQVDLSFRNLDRCVIQVYRIDLLKFGLLKRNLANVTSINLAGIHPVFERELDLSDQEKYRDQTTTIDLPESAEGAYLIVCRGSDLHASGLALVSGIQLDVQEDATSGRVRATVRERQSGRYLPKVHVKIIGSNNESFLSGETDLRGVYIADGIQGLSTVIAKTEDDRYAFHRGDVHIGPPANEPESQQLQQRAADAEQVPFDANSDAQLLEGLKIRNGAIQLDNYKRQQELYFNDDAGVRVEAVK